MTHVRADKVERVAQEIGPLDLYGEESGDVLVIGWGGTYGALRQAAGILRREGKQVSHVHLRYLNPLNPRLEPLLRSFKEVLVPELNMGQLSLVLRAKYLVDARGLNKIQGQPFKVQEVLAAVRGLLDQQRSHMETHAQA
jgi:2-oxoglutarate ferredoxin oxidoreductase subunit alpha